MRYSSIARGALALAAALALVGESSAATYVFRQPSAGIQPVAAPVAAPAPTSCTLPWGVTLQLGQSALAYSSATVPYGSTCASETRSCDSSANLSGSYSFASCSVAAPASCTLPWGGTLATGAAPVTAYSASSATSPTTCSSLSTTLSCSNGVLSAANSGSTAGLVASCADAKTVALTSGARNWSDGTYATSCKAYLTGDASHTYSGNTGNGLYRINPDGAVVTAYCDMTNGGWTMVAKGTSDVNVAGWYAAVGNYNVPASPDPAASATWKYADTLINAIPKTVYKVTSLTGYAGTWFASGSCSYGHQTGGTGANNCGKVYSNESLTTLVQTGTGAANGISDNNGTSSYHILTNNSSGGAGNGWCAGNGTPGNGGCGAAGTRVTIVMWVK